MFRRNYGAYALLLIPFVALLYPGWYSVVKPSLAGIPFFVWYQMLWVVLVAPLLAGVWLATRTEGDDG